MAGAQALIDKTVQAFGRIDVLVNNVGGTIFIKPYHLYTEDEVKMELERSLYPTLWCCLAALPVMMKQKSGSIVNVGSQSTRGLYRLPYATSKGGILALTKVLAMEYGRHGIRINAMAPGGTEISDRVVPRQFIKPGMTVEEPEDEAAYRREMGEDIRSQQALKRRGSAGGAGRGDCVSRLRRRELHHRAGDQLQRRTVVAETGVDRAGLRRSPLHPEQEHRGHRKAHDQPVREVRQRADFLLHHLRHRQQRGHAALKVEQDHGAGGERQREVAEHG